MNPKHTPGPWLHTPGANDAGFIRAAVGGGIASVHFREDLGEMDANRRLIAAAPELLEALASTMTALRHCRDSAPAEWDALSHMAAFTELMAAWDRNKALIARIDGAQS